MIQDLEYRFLTLLQIAQTDLKCRRLQNTKKLLNHGEEEQKRLE
jgi:hypothetical protein